MLHGKSVTGAWSEAFGGRLAGIYTLVVQGERGTTFDELSGEVKHALWTVSNYSAAWWDVSAPRSRAVSNVILGLEDFVDRSESTANGLERWGTADYAQPQIDNNLAITSSTIHRFRCLPLGVQRSRSRLQSDTRTAMGYTYGASVGYHGFDSYMKITLDVRRSRTGEAIRDVLGALESVRNAVDASDLEDAWSAAARQYTSLFNTNTDAGKTLVRAFAETGTPDVYKRMYDGMHDIKPEHVAAVAQKWMADPHVVVVGDVTAITGDVSSVGLGAPIVRSMP